MGIIPDPVPEDNSCGDCFASGKTPSTLKVFFGGIQKGQGWNASMGPPPNGYHDIVVSPFGNCQWLTEFGTFPLVTYNAAPFPSRLLFRLSLGIKYFESGGYPACSDHFDNALDTFHGNDFYGGFAYIGTAMKVASEIELVTPLFDPDPRMELFPMADSQIVIRYAGKRDATNISIKLDTND